MPKIDICKTHGKAITPPFIDADETFKSIYGYVNEELPASNQTSCSKH